MVETNKHKKGKKKHKVKKILIIVIISILLSIIYYQKSLSPISLENPKDIILEIPTGSSSNEIASLLKKEGLIRNEYIFKIYLKRNNIENSLKAGYYTLNTGMDMEEIILQISSGGENRDVKTFTIPEGYELRHMADKLSEEGIVDKERFIELTSDKDHFENKYTFLKELNEGQSLEGFLFPSTYEIYTNSTEEEIIDKMLSKFNEIYEEKIQENMSNVNLSLNETVILASIIEREGKRDDERELISGVFHNRLEQGIPLQSCATVQYILGERKEVLTDKDTAIESEFNTYINEELPPAPIAAPGEKSLIAAINPEDTDYLYFRTKEDGTGAHTFSRTYEEHLDADPNK